MEKSDKLRVLIPHWIEHNQEHAEEFLQYLGAEERINSNLQTAAEKIAQANLVLSAALDILGGPLDYPIPQEHHHHEHSHHHDHEHNHGDETHLHNHEN